MDELKDVYAHFLLHYGRDVPKMQVSAQLRYIMLSQIPAVT